MYAIRSYYVTTKNNAPMTKGNHAPWDILLILAPKNGMSTSRNATLTNPLAMRLQPHNFRMTAKKRAVVISMVMVTAAPYAADKLLVITSYSIHYTKLYDRLQSVSNTSITMVIGGRPRQLRIDFDPQALAARGLALDDLRRALAGANVDFPAGHLQHA